MRPPAWLLEVRDGIGDWLLSLRVEDRPGLYRWCRKGSAFEPGPHAGLGASSLALKIAYQTGTLGTLHAAERAGWIAHIQSFQRPHFRPRAGWFEDPLVVGPADRRAGRFRRDLAPRRAETRQACAALAGAGATPRHSIRGVPRSARGVRRYLDALPWRDNPWAAGSHASHLVFFLRLNAESFGERDAYATLVPVVLARLEAMQDERTGSWTPAAVAPGQAINAAMKVLTMHALLGGQPRWPERLVDLCLDHRTEADACHSVDVVYVLHQCARWTDHRSADVRAFAGRMLAALERHRKADGAFSFEPDRTGTDYYGAVVALGLPESDVHGTHLLVWMAAMLADLLGFADELGWRAPVT